MKQITYHYDFDGRRIDVMRRHVGTAYPRNGNAHNPTEYHVWDARLDGDVVAARCPTRAEAYEHARAAALGIDYVNRPRRSVNVRNHTLVADEMRANYRGRTTPPT